MSQFLVGVPVFVWGGRSPLHVGHGHFVADVELLEHGLHGGQLLWGDEDGGALAAARRRPEVQLVAQRRQGEAALIVQGLRVQEAVPGEGKVGFSAGSEGRDNALLCEVWESFIPNASEQILQNSRSGIGAKITFCQWICGGKSDIEKSKFVHILCTVVLFIQLR